MASYFRFDGIDGEVKPAGTGAASVPMDDGSVIFIRDSVGGTSLAGTDIFVFDFAGEDEGTAIMIGGWGAASYQYDFHSASSAAIDPYRSFKFQVDMSGSEADIAPGFAEVTGIVDDLVIA